MFMQVINFIMDAGSSVFMPVIIFALGLVFGLKPSKSFGAGITVGIGFIGINLVIELLANNLMVVIDQLVELYHFKLTAIDVGWPIAASIAWSGKAVVPAILVAVFVMNIILVVTGFTKTLDIDIWNYWQPLFIGGALYLLSGNFIFSVIAACLSMAIIFKVADFSQPYIEEFFGIPGISIPHIESSGWALLCIPVNKLIDRIPVIGKIDLTPEKIQKRLGILGEPYILGLFIGAILALIAQVDAATIMNTAIVTAAAMFILPKMIGILMEGLMPVTSAASEFMQKKFHGREVYIGLDAAVVVGHPSIIATALLLIPTTLILAVILPGNVTLPLAELSGLTFFTVWAVVPSKGNVFRGWLIGTFIMTVVLLISSDYAPVMTSLGNNVGYQFPEGASMVTCLSIGSQWISWIIYKIFSLFI